MKAFHKQLVWPVMLARVWTHYTIGKLNLWPLFCNVCIDFFEQPNMKGHHAWIEWFSSVTMSSTDFSLPKPDLLKFIWIFTGKNHLKINISHIRNPNLPNKLCWILLINVFPTPKAHSNSFKIFSYDLI